MPFHSRKLRRVETAPRGSMVVRRGRLVMPAMLLLFLAGCTVGPDYVKPTAFAPAAYKEIAAGAGWKPAQPRDGIARGAWWEIFADPQLNALMAQVRVANQDVAAAEAAYRQARALVRAARSAFFPTVAAGASYTRSRSPGSGESSRSSSGASGFTSSSYALPFDAIWEPDLWGRVRRSVESERASAQASAAELESILLSLHAELAVNYFQLRAVDALKRLYDETLEAYRKSLQVTMNRYRAGIASRGDVLQAETQLRTTEARAVDLGVQRGQLENAVAVLVGKPASVFSIPFSPLDMEPPEVPVGVPSELLERRPDIAAAERRVAAANARIGVAEAAFYPNITLSASAGFQAANPGSWLTWPSRFWAVGSDLSQTIFEGGFRRAQLEQARAALEQSVADYRQTVLIGFREVEDNLIALRVLAEEARVQEEAVEAAVQSVAISRNQYQAGLISYLEVVVVQATALNDQRAAIDILSRRMASVVQLVRALGGGWTSAELPDPDAETPETPETPEAEKTTPTST